MITEITLLPEKLRAAAREFPRPTFEAQVGADKVLLVRVEKVTDAMVTHLQHAIARDSENGLKRSHTKFARELIVQTRKAPRGLRPTELAKMLLEGPFFVLPMIARGARVGVGRGREQDIVLYHQSVSRFHAWFNSDPDGNHFLADNGSTNGTRVNGRPVPKGKLVDVHPGDRVTFGDIKTLFCQTATLWAVLNDAL